MMFLPRDSSYRLSRISRFRSLFVFFKCPVCLFSLLFLPLSLSFASDDPFTGPANWGGTGLMEIPTARVMKESGFRLGASQIQPYRYYYGVLAPVKGLEIGGKITEIMGVPGFNPGDPYGDYKDKSIDLKYQFLPEGKYMPALALGIFDPQGTALYRSQFIVASKQIYPFDFTLG